MTRKTYTFFVLDTDTTNLSRFKQLFEKESHFVYCCSTIKETRTIMDGVAPDFVISNLQLDEDIALPFLLEIRKKHPNAIRIVYSHEEKKHELMKLVAAGIAHRYLCFPWDKNSIASILQKDLKTRARLKRKKCWKYLEAGGNIPALPSVVYEVESILSRDDYSSRDLVGVIEKDPAISSKVLQVVNSAAFARSSVISSLDHAVTYVGSLQIREIVLYISAIMTFNVSEKCHPYIEEVGEHSFQCSRLAVEIAREIMPDLALEVATAALLHDIGKLVFYSTACGLYKDYIEAKDSSEVTSTEFETDLFGVNHAEIGSSLMLWWNLPMNIVETAANHTLPIKELWDVPLAVSIADRCLLEAQNQDIIKTDLDLIADQYPVEKWRNRAKEIIDEKSV